MTLAGALVLVLALTGSNESAHKSAAQEHFQRGQKLYGAGHFTDALSEFKAGYKSYPVPAFLINIGQTYRKMGERSKAITAYQQYLDLQPPDDPLRRRVEELVRKLEDEQRAELLAARARAQAPPPAVDLSIRPTAPPAPATASTPATSAPASAAAPTLAAAPAPTPALPALSAPAPGPPPDQGSSWYGHWWVWALVGAAAAGGAAAAVTLSSGGSGGVGGGSLGLIDGRR